MTTVEHVKDMQFSDSFHRVKRASLAYSAGTLVLAWIDPGHPVKAPGLDIAMPVDDVLLFLWIAAAYYFVGFILEYRNAIRQNSRLSAGEGGTVDDRLRSLVSAWWETSQSLRSTWKQTVEGLSHAIGHTDNEWFPRPPDGDITKKFPDRAAWLRHLTDEVLRSMDDRGKPGYFTETNILALIPKITERVFNNVLGNQLLGDTNDLLQKIDRDAVELASSVYGARREMRSLMDGIGLERRVLFTWWDLGGVTVTYAVATFLVGRAEWHHFASLASRLL